MNTFRLLTVLCLAFMTFSPANAQNIYFDWVPGLVEEINQGIKLYNPNTAIDIDTIEKQLYVYENGCRNEVSWDNWGVITNTYRKPLKYGFYLPIRKIRRYCNEDSDVFDYVKFQSVDFKFKKKKEADIVFSKVYKLDRGIRQVLKNRKNRLLQRKKSSREIYAQLLPLMQEEMVKGFPYAKNNPPYQEDEEQAYYNPPFLKNSGRLKASYVYHKKHRKYTIGIDRTFDGLVYDEFFKLANDVLDLREPYGPTPGYAAIKIPDSEETFFLESNYGFMRTTLNYNHARQPFADFISYNTNEFYKDLNKVLETFANTNSTATNKDLLLPTSDNMELTMENGELILSQQLDFHHLLFLESLFFIMEEKIGKILQVNLMWEECLKDLSISSYMEPEAFSKFYSRHYLLFNVKGKSILMKIDEARGRDSAQITLYKNNDKRYKELVQEIKGEKEADRRDWVASEQERKRKIHEKRMAKENEVRALFKKHINKLGKKVLHSREFTAANVNDETFLKYDFSGKELAKYRNIEVMIFYFEEDYEKGNEPMLYGTSKYIREDEKNVEIEEQRIAEGVLYTTGSLYYEHNIMHIRLTAQGLKKGWYYVLGKS